MWTPLECFPYEMAFVKKTWNKIKLSIVLILLVLNNRTLELSNDVLNDFVLQLAFSSCQNIDFDYFHFPSNFLEYMIFHTKQFEFVLFVNDPFNEKP